MNGFMLGEWLRVKSKTREPAPLAFHQAPWNPEALALLQASGTARAAFETGLRQYLRLEPSASVTLLGSGRGALNLGLAALSRGRPSRKKVIVPSYCCTAVVPPVVDNGFVPVFIDTGPELVSTGDQYVAAMADDVLGVLIVNLCGKRLADTERARVLERARSMGIVSIEDNCHYLVPMAEQPRADMELHSFGFGKVLSATAGGALILRVANEDIDAEIRTYDTETTDAARTRLRSYMARFHGSVDAPSEEALQQARTQYGRVLMNDFDAALALAQLNDLSGHVCKQMGIGRSLTKTLRNHPQVYSSQSTDNNIFTRVSVILRDVEAFNKFWTHMDSERKIGLEGMYLPLHLKFPDLHSGRSLPQAEDVYRRVFNIPGRTSLSIFDVARIRTALDEFAEAS